MRGLWILGLLGALVLSAAPSLVAAGGSVTPGTASQVAALVAASVHIKSLTSAQEAALTTAGLENADIAFHIPTLCDSATTCVYGDTSATTTVVVLGDSHVRMWLPALATTATADRFRIVVLGRDGCPVISYKVFTYQDCVGVMSHALKVIDALKPAAVIVGDRTSLLPTISLATWQRAETDLLDALKGSGAAVAVIGDIQAFNLEPVDCLAIHPRNVQLCGSPNPDPAKPGHESAEQAGAAAAGVAYVDPQPWLCTSTRCSPVVGPYFAYWDDTHVSVPYARYLAGVLATALKPTLAGA